MMFTCFLHSMHRSSKLLSIHFFLSSASACKDLPQRLYSASYVDLSQFTDTLTHNINQSHHPTPVCSLSPYKKEKQKQKSKLIRPAPTSLTVGLVHGLFAVFFRHSPESHDTDRNSNHVHCVCGKRIILLPIPIGLELSRIV